MARQTAGNHSEIGETERAIRDVVALSTLPSIWLGAEPPRIVESLAAALFATLRPAFAFVSFAGESRAAPLAVLQTSDGVNTGDHARALHAELLAWARKNDFEELVVLPRAVPFGVTCAAVRPIGFLAEFGVIAAGFLNGTGPTRSHRLLLDIGASQASAAVQNAQLLRSLRVAMAERDRTAAELWQQLAASTAVNNSLGEGVMIIDAESRVTFLNPVAERLLGYANQELAGQPVHQAIHYKHPDGAPYPEHECPFLRVLETGEAVHRDDDWFVRRDGSLFHVEVTCAPILSSDGITGSTFVFRDITERKRAELALRASEARQASILNTALDGIIVSDHEGNILDFNPAAEAIFGYRRADVLGKQMADLIIPERLRARHHAGMARYLATRENRIMGKRLEMAALRADGSEFAAELVIAHIPDSDPPVFTGFVRDITQRLERERTLRLLFEINEATQPLSDPEEITARVAELLGRNLGVNRCAYAKVLGDQDEFIITGDYTHETFSIVGRFRMSAFGDEALRLMRANKVYVVEDTEADPRTEGRRDAYRATEIRAVICVPLHKAGRFVAAMAVHQKWPRKWTPAEIELVRLVVNRCWESLERARAASALRESEERHRLIVENVKDFAILSTDLSGRVTHWNPGAEALFGWSDSEMLGELADRIYTPEDRAAGVPAAERRQAAEHGCALDDRWHLRKNGERLFVTGSARPIFDRGGTIIGFNKVARDITERKQLEDELLQARENLEKTVRERTAKLEETIGELEAYSYSIAHDMRAPLRAMQGFSLILLEEHAARLDDEGREHLQRIANAANRLDRLIQDILTYSRIARGDLRRERIDLDQLVTETIEHYPSFQPPRAEMLIDRPLMPVIGHEASLTQCISNLLANAVKFVPPGTKPRVRIWTEPRGELVRLWIEDNGIGISEENQSRIFEIFVRVHPDKAYPGTGIGLSIVRKAIERMDGSVGLVSTLGQGSRFWIELPKA